jgi:hypothetical protein
MISSSAALDGKGGTIKDIIHIERGNAERIFFLNPGQKRSFWRYGRR